MIKVQTRQPWRGPASHRCLIHDPHCCGWNTWLTLTEGRAYITKSTVPEYSLTQLDVMLVGVVIWHLQSGSSQKVVSWLSFSFYSVLDQNPRNGIITVKLGLPASVDPAYKHLQRHVQSLVSQVIVDPVELTINVNCPITRNWREIRAMLRKRRALWVTLSHESGALGKGCAEMAQLLSWDWENTDVPFLPTLVGYLLHEQTSVLAQTREASAQSRTEVEAHWPAVRRLGSWKKDKWSCF